MTKWFRRIILTAWIAGALFWLVWKIARVP